MKPISNIRSNIEEDLTQHPLTPTPVSAPVQPTLPHKVLGGNTDKEIFSRSARKGISYSSNWEQTTGSRSNKVVAARKVEEEKKTTERKPAEKPAAPIPAKPQESLSVPPSFGQVIESLDPVYQKALVAAVAALAQSFVTPSQANALARDAIPRSLRNIDQSPPTGDALRFGPFGDAYWGPSGGNGGMDYDFVYIGGIEYTPGSNPNGYDFLQVGADGSSSWIPAMISPMPTGYEIYNVKKNHIHITGATAGNI